MRSTPYPGNSILQSSSGCSSGSSISSDPDANSKYTLSTIPQSPKSLVTPFGTSVLLSGLLKQILEEVKSSNQELREKVAQLEKRLDETPRRKARVVPPKEVRVCHLVQPKEKCTFQRTV